MPFDDSDLKRLKEMMGDYSITKRCAFDYNDIKALLARLETAEKYIESLNTPAEDDLYWMWRKASGKDR